MQTDRNPASVRVVLSVPPLLQSVISTAVPGALATAGAFEALFREARRIVKVFSPYVDASFTALLRTCRAPVRIVTTALEGRRLRGRPVLERCAASFPVAVRYVTEVQGDARIFQMHAKMVLADSQRAYLGSANITETSLNHNLEVGLLITDPRTVASLERLFDLVFEKVSVPTRLLRA